MTIACVLCSMGGVVAVLALGVLFIATGPGVRPKLSAIMLTLAFVGAASCAAEDRVCEIAERQAPP